jgi:hypothetical protein
MPEASLESIRVLIQEVLDVQRRSAERLDGIEACLDRIDIKTRVGILEQQYASLSNRIGRIESRLDRIDIDSN